ncbi:hypothetical protein B0H16DRAFT_1428116 [Mycena metata]|uniref:F-box domain-containing protein n=1 Tax=Mycena metata TaxID=1033252 RepID=A0AAD7HWC5_9AGAR|nr:hypothetical protein B0H16DRAFT_1428116 [Mycena metata]
MVSSKFWVVPRLHTLRLGSHRQLAEAAYNFDRTQIRTLALCDPNGHQLLPYPNVTDLTCIESSHFRANISFIGPPPISPRLKTLKINFSSLDFVRGTAANVPNIFRRFTAPALSSLDVQQLRLEPGELIDFLHRSQCNLTTLVLRQCLLRISGLLQILECTPNLGSFSAVDGHSTMITNRLFQYLSIGSDAIVNLPRLSSLTIRGSFAFEDVALVQMLETRMAGEDPHSDGTFICFSDVFLSLPERTVKPEIKARLRHLQGVTVSLECLNDNKIMCRAF